MKKISISATALSLTLLLTGCGTTQQPQGTTAQTNAPAAQFKVAANIPYADQNAIQSNIVNECTTLGQTLSDSTKTNIQKQGFSVTQNDSVNAGDSGKNVVIKITNALSRGAAGVGHNKFVSIQAQLFEDGELVDTYNAQRSSGGGFFGGFKSSCSVLARCATTLGSDVAKWLKKIEKKQG